MHMRPQCLHARMWAECFMCIHAPLSSNTYVHG